MAAFCVPFDTAGPRVWLKTWFAHEDLNHGKYSVLLFMCYFCLLYTVKFTKVGLMENGEAGSRLEMNGVRLLS